VKKAILITRSFPYSDACEDSFILPELPYLCAEFDEVIIIPERITGCACDIAMFGNVFVNTSYAMFLGSNRIGSLMIAAIEYIPVLLREISKNERRMTFEIIGSVIRAWLAAVKRSIWLKKYCRNEKGTVYYTYWFDGSTLALAFLGIRPLVTRAHGYDLFEERHNNGIIPFRKYALGELTKLFLVSEAGLDYITGRYPEYSEKYILAPIGCVDHGLGMGPSIDGIIRIVSCAYVVSIKRIDLILDSMKALALTTPGIRVIWTHIGDGELYSDLQNKAKDDTEGLEIHLLGKLETDDVLRYYRVNHVDLFIHLSLTEGGRPISIAEAISYGIPVVACDAGGVRELVSSENGRLLPVSVDSATVAEACLSIIRSERYLDMCNASRQKWNEFANANDNMRIFSKLLSSIYS